MNFYFKSNMKDQQEDNETKKYFEDLGRYLEKLSDHKLETEKEYQKVILLISGGALSVSLSFSDGLASTNNNILKWVLIIGWLLLLITILFQLVYYRQVRDASNELIGKIETSIEGRQVDDELGSVYLKNIGKLDKANRNSVRIMYVGLICISFSFSWKLLFHNPTTNSVDQIPEKDCETENCKPKESNIVIENNPVFINGIGKMDTIKELIKCKHKPCR